MPRCKICKKRIEISRTGVWAYRCRICGRTVCKEHFDIVRRICHVCAAPRPKLNIS